MTIRILRGPDVWGRGGRLGVSRTHFCDHFVLHDPADPFVPNTDGKVRRVRAVPLAGRAKGFVEDEIDQIGAQLIELRDATPLPVKPKQAVAARRPAGEPRRRAGSRP